MNAKQQRPGEKSCPSCSGHPYSRGVRCETCDGEGMILEQELAKEELSSFFNELKELLIEPEPITTMPKPVYSKAKQLEELFKREGKMHLPSLAHGPLTGWKGSTSAKLAIVMSVYPATSREYKLILEILSSHRITPHDVYLTTSTKHSLLKYTDHGNVIDTRSVTQTEVDQLRPFLLEELSIVAPRIVLCLGSNSTKILLGDTSFSVTKEIGTMVSCEGLNAGVVATYSPSFALLRNRNNAPLGQLSKEVKQISDDVKWAFDEAYAG